LRSWNPKEGCDSSPAALTATANLDGAPYVFLHCRQRTDCLDLAKSKIIVDEEGDVHEVRRYVFDKDRLSDPSFFVIPQQPYCLFCTESILEIVAGAGLKGFDFSLADGPRKRKQPRKH
jgi:hypothetical protein